MIMVKESPKRYTWTNKDSSYECTENMTYPYLDLGTGSVVVTGSLIAGLTTGGIAFAPVALGLGMLASGFIGKSEVDECKNFKYYKSGGTVDFIIQ